MNQTRDEKGDRKARVTRNCRVTRDEGEGVIDDQTSMPYQKSAEHLVPGNTVGSNVSGAQFGPVA